MKNFIAGNATLVGDVILGREVTVWYNSVLRGDCAPISIGDRTNVQDGTVIHVDHATPCEVGNNITVGHQCLLHGCKVEDGALIGMGSIVMNNAVVGKNSMVGAGSLVTQGTVIPPNSLALGRPARVVRELTAEEIEKNKENVNHYCQLGQDYLSGKYPEYKNDY
ncbi:gamma carbonic anhydrase family protein [Tetragenococcus koreensis]|uniref:gamma carbonic anhydrase family protein n=1 Tax=Tetragenococcus koreensis TaxID=290335 RepID=UPI001F2B6C6C|nr:gamma carbonic anhydrase family protein [Tetragenococcus koreensis]MCF1617692.1 gamma carbonic anhydrase family protein [Tetragenococcus koreensis]MCF1622505.1 gamma carbonic anhydrase family protein [Tetragenococcus koreensis]MCF1630916.1 gamma carbonic anhydrase family protein [Tetragenococcus koreensis]MCF1678623.1 gamma carbonic anhydrase family protein [Tetragenococcus koreensis]MCF1681026.1 gamma carbonic anhydrase family protein [Tetragenococcus koreensis]